MRDLDFASFLHESHLQGCIRSTCKRNRRVKQNRGTYLLSFDTLTCDNSAALCAARFLLFALQCLGGDGLGHTTQRVHVASPETINSFSLKLQDPGVFAVAAMAHRPWWQRVFDSVEPSSTPSPSPPPQLSRSAGIVLVSDEDSPVPLALRASDLPEWAPSPGDARWVDEFTRGGLGSLPRRQISKMAGQGSRSGRRHAPRPRDHRGSQPRIAAPAVSSAYASSSSSAGAALGLSAPAGACFGTPPAFASAASVPPPGTAARAPAAAPAAAQGSCVKFHISHFT